MEVVLASSVSMVSQAIVAETVKRTSAKVFESVHEASLSEHPKVHALYDQLDLQAKLETVQALIKDVSRKKFPKRTDEAVQTCVHHLHLAVEMIDVDLASIDRAIAEHHQMYLRGFRKPDYHDALANLKEHALMLDTRIDRLLQMMSLTRPMSGSFVTS